MAVLDFEQGLDYILIDCVETSELEISFNESDTITSSVFRIPLLSMVSEMSNAVQTPSIKSPKLWC